MFDETILSAVREIIGLPGAPGDHRIVVAMSGGVDSSVAAGLVAACGYETIGITLQLYDHGAAIAKKGSCCAGQDIHDARQVAAKLNIAHYVLDYESRFKETVIDEFVDSYLAGETPVPCISCNQTVKFADLLAQSREMGASAMVTGHYVDTRPDRSSNHRLMFTPVDMRRDQSYFLFATRREQLDFLRFPLAGIEKPKIRQMAGEMGLNIADKPDSQDICFVPDGRYSDLIAKMRPDACDPGDIVHIDGQVLGRHEGIVNYTVGQRRGIGIAAANPLYVTRLDADSRTVFVGPREALLTSRVELKDINWIAGKAIDNYLSGQVIYAKLRSTRPAMQCLLHFDGNKYSIELIKGDYGVSAGQACVLYSDTGSGAEVLGGGFIAATDR